MDTLKVIPLRPDLWALDEVGKTIMYVINGRDKALLVDTGFAGRKKLLWKTVTATWIMTPVTINSHGFTWEDMMNRKHISS